MGGSERERREAAKSCSSDIEVSSNLPLMLLSILALLALPVSSLAGIKLQNGFERVYIQVATSCLSTSLFTTSQPFGINGFRVRATILRDPTGNEPSALLDPPLEGPSSKGLDHSIHVPFMGNGSVRNGDLVVDVLLGAISFSRADSNGTRVPLTREFKDTKSPYARNYVQSLRGNAYQAQFSFSSDPEEMFFGTGQQACCNDNSVNKKGQVVDLFNYNSHVTLPVWMSNKVCISSILALVLNICRDTSSS